MGTVMLDRSIDLACPQHQAYETLSRFDVYAQLPGVVDVTPLGGNRAHVVEEYDGIEGEFDVELDEIPEERIDLRAIGGPTVTSSLQLEPLDDEHTRLELHAEVDTELLEQYNLDAEDLERLADEQLASVKAYAENPAV